MKVTIINSFIQHALCIICLCNDYNEQAQPELNPAIRSYCGTIKTDNTSEVCVFCHTPHGGTTDGPL